MICDHRYVHNNSKICKNNYNNVNIRTTMEYFNSICTQWYNEDLNYDRTLSHEPLSNGDNTFSSKRNENISINYSVYHINRFTLQITNIKFIYKIACFL